METETAQSVALALMDCVDGDGEIGPLIHSLASRIDELDTDSMTEIMTAMTMALAYRADMSPKEVLQGLYDGAPSDAEWRRLSKAIAEIT